MHMKAACLVALLGASSPAQQDPAPQPSPLERWGAVLPQDTLLFAALDDVVPHFEQLRSTSLFHIVSTLNGAFDLQDAMAPLLEGVQDAVGLDRDAVTEILAGGGALAVVPDDARGIGGLLQLNLGAHSEAVAAALDNATQGADASLQATDLDGISMWSTLDEAPIILAVHEGRLVAGTTASLVQNVLSGFRPADDGIGAGDGYRSFVTRATGSGAPLLAIYARFDAIVAHALAMVGDADAERVVGALELDQIADISFTVHARDGLLRDELRLAYPAPRRGLLGALLGPGTPVKPTTGHLIPPDVSAFSVAHIDAIAVYEQLLALLRVAEPRAADMAEEALEGMRGALGIRLEADVLEPLGHQVVSLQWPGEEDATEFAMLLELRNSERLHGTFQRLLERMGASPSTRDRADNTVYSLLDAGLGLPPGFAPQLSFTDNHLVFAANERTMNTALDQLQQPRDNSEALELLATLPPGTTSVSRTSLREAMRSLSTAILGSDTGLDPIAVQTLAQEFDRIEGHAEYRLAIDDREVVLTSASPIGNIYAAGGLAVAGAVAMPSLMAARQEALRQQAVTPTESVRTALLRIHSNQRALWTERERFASLEMLRKDDLVLQEALLPTEHNGVFRTGEYLMHQVMTADERYFAVLAWPSRERTGTVLASLPNRPLLGNDAIAAALGMRTAALTDLYLDGRFGGSMVPGWRDLEQTNIEEHADSTELFSAILQAEQRGIATVPQRVVDALHHSNPAVACRAAFALGELRALDAVPDLCEALTAHPEEAVRLQAMVALNKIADQRSSKAVIQGLLSNNAALRTLAANTLGQLRATEAIEGLLALLEREAGSDRRDRVAALVALADIGDAACLAPAAASVRAEDAHEMKALAYLFQVLSPKLAPPAEVTELGKATGHPAAAVRRYAMQRLAELGSHSTAALPQLQRRATDDEDGQLRALAAMAVRGIEAAQAGTTPATPGSAASKTPSRTTLALGAGGAALVVGLFGLFFLRRRSRRRAEAEDELEAAHAEHEDDLEGDYDDGAEDEDYEDYDDDSDYGDDEDAELEDAPAPVFDAEAEQGEAEAAVATDGDDGWDLDLEDEPRS